MLILIDLDGTILNSVHPTWKPYKDGQRGYCIEGFLDKLPWMYGAREFIESQKQKGNQILVLSDSHPLYVEPICRYLNVDCVSLTDKPNKQKLLSFLETRLQYKQLVNDKDCVLIGDTVLDIELGRSLGIQTIWILPYPITDDIKNEKDKVGDEMGAKKMGPTFAVKSFAKVEKILDNPIDYLYAIESSIAGGYSPHSIKYAYNKFADGSYAALRCLARQEAGSCDVYARADQYYLMANPNRTAELVSNLAKGVSAYINQPGVTNQGWDYFTYVTDKQSTVPVNKMKEVFDLVETTIPKVLLLKWADNVQGSLRNRNLYNERKSFLENYLFVDTQDVNADGETLSDSLIDNRLCIKGKNIIVLDDQLTTSATAWHVIHKLKEKGANNVLFIALFQMILPVASNILCPNCGKPMFIKIRRSDGHKFYSCTPPQYKGEGCGYIQDIPNQ